MGGCYAVNQSKAAVEQCRSIDIRRWQREGLLERPSFVWSWFTPSGKVTASIGVRPGKERLVLAYKVDDEPIYITVPYDETVTGFGRRKWFLCPACSKRCAVLYLKEKCFACRECHNLNYRSSQLSGSLTYYHRQLQKLCRILKAEYDPSSVLAPVKPKYMKWTAYYKHAERYRQLALKRDELFIARARQIVNRSIKA